MRKFLKEFAMFLFSKKKNKACFVLGHKWSSDFNPKKEMEKGIKSRVYCLRCGIRYHTHEFKDLKSSENGKDVQRQ